MKEIQIPEIYSSHSRGPELYLKGFRFNRHGDLAMFAHDYIEQYEEQHGWQRGLDKWWAVKNG